MRFVMRGSLGFPIDMLRYDSAWPASESDANAITRSVAHAGSDGPVDIEIYMRQYPTVARWRSFGWVVYAVYDAELGVLQKVHA
jgi:hypothetical protein